MARTNRYSLPLGLVDELAMGPPQYICEFVRFRAHAPTVLALGALALSTVSCGDTPRGPRTGRPADLSAAIKKSAIDLQTAIERKLVRAYPLDGSSTAQSMAIVLEPLVKTQPWIRIRAGWRLSVPEVESVDGVPADTGAARDCSYTTYLTRYVHVRREKTHVERVPHLQLNFSKKRHIPDKCVLTRVEDEKFLEFSASLDELEEQPKWKSVQLALWALTDNVSYRSIGSVTASGAPIPRDSLRFAPQEIADVFALLEDRGHSRREFALWADAQDEIERVAERYEQLMLDSDSMALNSFTKIAQFYPLDAATDFIVGAFDRHSGRGRNAIYRRTAFDALARVGSSKELDVLRRVADIEDDEALRTDMLKVIGTAAPAK